MKCPYCQRIFPDHYWGVSGKAGQRVPTPEEAVIFRLIGDGAMIRSEIIKLEKLKDG